MPTRFTDPRSYFHLTVEDLVQAQQIFHADLFERANVEATAVGRYRQRIDRSDDGPKTLGNTEVRENSWPCLLVFVSEWVAPSKFYHATMYHQLVPPYITLPDRRRVPTCVLKVETDEALDPPLFSRLNFPTWMIGGGFPVVRRAQQEDRAGSLGCLVTDGANVYALTNRHVAGPPGSVIETFVNGRRQRIGVTAQKQVQKIELDAAFPGFQLSKGWAQGVTYTNADTGLIEVDDVHSWTAQVYGLGEMGSLYDLSADTISLDLVGRHVSAFGAASGELHGEIHGFFYRYRTVGAVGYVSDVLIGPLAGEELQTIPGDSGTLWCLESERRDKSRKMRPIAVQWGGQKFESGGRFRVALATSLSTILRTLDVDLITDWNTGHREYWGKSGHFKVAASACAATAGVAKDIIDRNKDLISFSDPDVTKFKTGARKNKFVPLTDVADLIWRNTRKGRDEANHFADMDQKAPKGAFKGKSLLDITKGHPENIDADTWVGFYRDAGTDGNHFGALPFRVWQMFDEAVAALKNHQSDRWLTAMGLMAHYVGDACQPLHVSELHHGHPDNPAENKVHSVYESNMLDRNVFDLVQRVNQKVQKVTADNIANGQSAAREVVELMRRTIAALPPQRIIDVFNDTDGDTAKMWEELADDTAARIADGAETLAMLWNSAWKAGGGTSADARAFKDTDLMKLYNDPSFVASVHLDVMATNGMLKKAGAKPPKGPKIQVKKHSGDQPAHKPRPRKRAPRANA